MCGMSKELSLLHIENEKLKEAVKKLEEVCEQWRELVKKINLKK